ncbi:hypothetical protein BHE90_014212 [Fusarium euwallaceae]|uniref:Fungal-type protein kinase domain-containing protein n=1 Tax=Fusarium euwallaceae TaxID=1147111 RepID=A0A430L6R5_9HYPO|nr:hypothetical protein BHE90_014212 [Fusarium euwallaceae]
MHDLESFFWVLFWICIHYDAQGKDIGPTGFDDWNYENDDKLVAAKKDEIADEEDFLKKADKNFTSHYRPLIPWVNRLRRKVFPNGGRWKRQEPELYSPMTKILRDARKDPEVLADGPLQWERQRPWGIAELEAPTSSHFSSVERRGNL